MEVIGDDDVEPDETFLVNLDNLLTSGRSVTFSDSQGQGTILNDDAAPVNNAPDAADDAYSVDEDQTLTVNAASGALANDSDPESDPLTASLLTGVSNGILSLNPDGSFAYTPNLNFNGNDSFTYTISDGSGGTDAATVNVTVVPVNGAPTAGNNPYNVDEDQGLMVNAAPGVLANDNDVDGDALTASLVTDVSNGALTLNWEHYPILTARG